MLGTFGVDLICGEGLLVYLILKIIGQLHRLNSELEDQQFALPT